MKKVDVIVGARPNFIKAFPVYNELNKLNYFKLRLVNTGQHYDDAMADIFFRQLKMKQPDINLEVGSGYHAEQTASIMCKLEKIYIKDRPDLIILFGDVNSTLAAALVASKLRIKIAHVEAGLRSFDRLMPEEINRVLTDQISDILFTTSLEAQKNLINEGINKKNIYFVGNTMIDTLKNNLEHFNANPANDLFNINDKQYIVITLHRPSNVDDISKLNEIIQSLNKVCEMIPCIWPMHPRTRKKINSLKSKINEKLIIMEPLGYIEFMSLQKNARLVLTDSGGIQEESTFFGVSCLTLRDNTERPVTTLVGTNKLIGTNYKNIFHEINIAINNVNDTIKKPKYWDGKSAKRIAKIINQRINNQ